MGSRILVCAYACVVDTGGECIVFGLAEAQYRKFRIENVRFKKHGENEPVR